MTTSSLGDRRNWVTLLTFASLVGGCANYPAAEAPAVEDEQSLAAPSAPTYAPTYAPAPAAAYAPAYAPAPVRPAALSIPPPPVARSHTDKTVTASYLTTEEYREALEYQAALERYLTDPFIVANHLATERLLRDSQVDPARYGRLAVTAFTDLDRSGHAAHLGQMIGGQIASRLIQLGYPVAEAEYAGRDAGGYGAGYQGAAVVVGHYAISQDRMFVTARLLDAGTGDRQVSAVDYALPLDPTTLGLITGCFRQGQWICRLP